MPTAKHSCIRALRRWVARWSGVKKDRRVEVTRRLFSSPYPLRTRPKAPRRGRFQTRYVPAFLSTTCREMSQTRESSPGVAKQNPHLPTTGAVGILSCEITGKVLEGSHNQLWVAGLQPRPFQPIPLT